MKRPSDHATTCFGQDRVQWLMKADQPPSPALAHRPSFAPSCPLLLPTTQPQASVSQVTSQGGASLVSSLSCCH